MHLHRSSHLNFPIRRNPFALGTVTFSYLYRLYEVTSRTDQNSVVVSSLPDVADVTAAVAVAVAAADVVVVVASYYLVWHPPDQHFFHQTFSAIALYRVSLVDVVVLLH